MKLLRKLTIKNLLMNKSRTIVSIIGIMLSVALITTVAGIVSSLDASNIYTSLVNSGDYDFYLLGERFKSDDIRTVKSNRNVKDVYSLEHINMYHLEDPKYQFVKLFSLYGTTSKTIEASCSQLKSGRFAENEDEIVISESMNRYSNREYKVGDTLSADYGKRFLKENIPGLEFFYEQFGGREIPEYLTGSFGDMEEWVKEGTKEFKIVGILKEELGFLSNDQYSYNTFFNESVKAYTYKEPEIVNFMLVDLWENAEKDYIQVISQVTGCNENDVESYLYHYADISSEAGQKIQEELKDNPMGIMGFGTNSDLLRSKGILKEANNSGGFQPSSFMVMFVGMLIVMLASVFIIRNGFEISITEKTRLYGMLSSVGATPKQIKQNVFFEAFLLGVVGIPLGILLGLGITAALVVFASSVLAEQLGSFKLIYQINVPAILLAIAVGIVTITCSAATSAKRASKTSPMEAIRSNKDVNITAKQLKKGYSTPNWVKKMFGIGGSIAWKNMKRSRKQYRTTVISIIVSVALFLAINSTVDFVMRALMSQDYYAIANSEYNMILYVNPSDDKGNGTAIPKGTEEKYFESVASGVGISKYRAYYFSYDFTFSVKEEDLCDEVKPDSPLYSRMTYDYVNDNKVNYSFMAVDKRTFMGLCDEAGLKYEDCKNKGFIWNYCIIDVDENGYTMPKPEKTQLFKDPVGMTLKGECTMTEEVYDETLEGDEYYENVQYVDHFYTAEVEIAASVEKIPASTLFGEGNGKKVIIVTTDRFGDFFVNPYNYTMDVYSSDPNALEDKIEESRMEGTTDISGVSNYSKMVNSLKSTMLVMQVFVYGFIIVISLIGITNLFNTVTTNMKLRQKEFAMLRSIGTTNKELHRMILLESALYTLKSLIIGIPIGVLGGYLLSMPMSTSLNASGVKDIYFQIPWMQMLMCLLVVLLLLFVIMRFSIAKFNKQNIIETIRNDNI